MAAVLPAAVRRGTGARRPVPPTDGAAGAPPCPPPRTTSGAASFGNVTHWGLDFAISLTVLTTINALTPTGLFWLYAVFGLLGVVYLHRKLPEAKGRSLEGISASLRGREREPVY